MSDGLEGVVAADTVLSEVDGQAGRLIIRGRSLDELAGRATFEQVTRLLLDGFFETLPDDLAPALAAARLEVFQEVSALDTGLLDRSPIEGMRALTARLADGDSLNVALRLAAAPAVFTAAMVRAQAGEAPVRPDLTLSHAADTLSMLRGNPPAPPRSPRSTLSSDRQRPAGLNASTFAARVIASTHAGPDLGGAGRDQRAEGPLHARRPGRSSTCWTPSGRRRTPGLDRGRRSRGDRLMGFGHRVYRVATRAPTR